MAEPLADDYCGPVDVQDELPRQLSMPLADEVRNDSDQVISSATKPSLSAVRRWITTESRWVDARLLDHVGADNLPLSNEGAREIVRPIVVWRVAVRVLIALDFVDEEEPVRSRRMEARFRMDEILRNSSMLGGETGGDDAAPEGGPGEADALDRYLVERGVAAAYGGGWSDRGSPW